ncbi:MAG: hypothetical protein R3Y24_01550 [Eubacteriales bacterium]
MGQVLLCVGQYAKNPYRFEQLGISIYSIEELCYFLYENSHLLDESIIDKELMEWIQEECELPTLAKDLQNTKYFASGLYRFLKKVFEYTGFYDEQVLSQVGDILQKNSKSSIYEKRIAQLEFMLQRKQYPLAISGYEKLLLKSNELSKEELGIIYHNYGVCKARIFRYKRAADAFYKAYEIKGSIESYEMYLSAKRIELEESRYLKLIGQEDNMHEHSLAVEGRLEEINQKWKVGDKFFQLDSMKAQIDDEENQYQEKIEEEIKIIKKNYLLLTQI